MNFFKSVFSEDSDPPGSESDNAHNSDSRDSPEAPNSSSTSHLHDPSGEWDFNSLIKTLTAKSESIIDIYRRDLQEFGTGLKKEIEVAQCSLNTLGNTVIKGTAQIISQGRDAIIESDPYNKKNNQTSLNSKQYSRFDAQVRAIQSDPRTYTEVPEDLDRYNNWKSEFSLDGKSEEMEEFLKENDAMESVYKRIVPNTVDSETFWYRYYYKVHKIKKAEDVRARLVRRMSREEEELSWDVEEDDDEEEEADSEKLEVLQEKGDDRSNVDLRKRLSVAAEEEEEELNWDIEDDDDDEAAKA